MAATINVDYINPILKATVTVVRDACRLDVSIGKDTIIYPGTNIQGETIIGENCIIGPNSTIISSTIGDNTIIESSKLDRASVGSNCVVGPYTYVTKNTYIKDNASLSSLREINNN